MPAEFNPQALLRHWFGDTRQNPDAIPARMDWWFSRDDARDRWLADAYLEPCAAAMEGVLHCPVDEADSRLAMILLTDQLPRNLFRGTAHAFASDARALDLCLYGHRLGLDQALTPIERVFFWMPLQHVEDLRLQELGVELFSSLVAIDPYRSKLWKGFAAYAKQHRDIIAQFGRFPHRNAVLGRQSTHDEAEYIAGGGASFGQ